MSLTTVTSPHAHTPLSTAGIMRYVLLAMTPGIITLIYFFGWGVLQNILIASASALLFEAGVMKWRGRPVMYYLKDCSALVTAFLIGVALPSFAPWWIVVSGTAFAILIVKHLYGGLGFNPFNPAMAAYVFLLISFPVSMTNWGTPDGIHQLPNFLQTLLIKLGMQSLPDALTHATPLDLARQNIQNASLTFNDLKNSSDYFSKLGGYGWEWVNLGFLAGGLFLLWKKIFTWHAPVSMLLALGIMALIFYSSGGSQSTGSPLFHWLTGATMLGAFFIITDPVTSAVSTRGRIIYGALIGILIFVIRRWGNYPDAVAFSVLLLNFAAPLIDHYTQPRTYGHKKS